MGDSFTGSPKPCSADAMAHQIQHAQMTFVKTFGKTELWALGLGVTTGCRFGGFGCLLGVTTWLESQPLIIFGATAKGSYDAYAEAFTNPTHECE
jgi:hypothetical protein